MPNAHGSGAAAQEEAKPSLIAELLGAALAKLRIKLLDLTNRNRLLNFRFSETSRKLVRVVDALPDELFRRLCDESIPAKKLYFEPLPEFEDRDVVESTGSFRRAMDVARHTDDAYLAAQQAAEHGQLDEEGQHQAEADLRDSVRKQFGPTPEGDSAKSKPSLADWARQHGIDPSYDLPEPGRGDRPGKDDDRLQTLLLPDALERKLSGVREAAILAEQELGLSTLYAAFGFLEWYESAESNDPRFAPLVLLPIKIDRQLKHGLYRYFVEGGDGDAAVNLTLRERLRRDLQLELPDFEEDDTPESYFFRVSALLTTHKRWTVRRFVVIGHFSFARLAMFEDLAPSKWTGGIEANQLLTSLLIGSEPRDSLTAEDYELENEEVERTVPILITDADSSQFSTLLDAMGGRSFALKGPPGTGKSQTITNLIALALAKGKKVLFVAEKMAALDVVAKRLRDAKLGPYLLELHSTKVQKKKVLQSFEERLNLRAPKPDQGLKHTLDSLRKVRAELTRYVALMNSEVGKTGTTLHKIYWLEQRSRRELGEEAYKVARRLREPNAAEISGHVFTARLEVLAGLAEFWKRCVAEAGGNIATHPLKAFECANVSPVDYHALQDDIRAWAEFAAKFEGLRADLAHTLRCHIPETLSASNAVCDKLLRLADAKTGIDSALLSLASRGETFVKLEEVAGQIQQILTSERDLSLHFDNVPLLIKDLSRLRGAAAVVAEVSARLSVSEQVSPSALVARFDEEQLRAARLVDSLDLAGRVTGAADAIGPLTVSELDCVIDFVDLLHQSSESAIRGRRESLYGPDAYECLNNAAQTATRLRKEHQRLSQAFDFEKLERAPALKEFAAALRGTHPVLALISPRCRRARQYFSFITKGKKAARHQIANSFDELASLLVQSSNFTSDDQLRRVAGDSLRGLSTDFSSLLGANDLATRARHRFSSLNARQVGYQRFLLLGDAQFLVDIREALKPEDLKYLRQWSRASAVPPTGDLAAVAGEWRGLAVRGADSATTLAAIALRVSLTAQELRVKLDSAHSLSSLRKALEESVVAKQIRLSVPTLSIADGERISQALTVAKEIVALSLPPDMTAIILSPNYAAAVTGLKKAAVLMTRAQAHYNEFPAQLLARFDVRVSHFAEESELRLVEVAERLRLASSVGDNVVSSWANYCRLQKESQKQQLGFIVDCVHTGQISGEVAAKTYAFVHFRSLIRTAHESTNELSSWTGEHLDSLRKRLRSLDVEYLERGQQWLRSTLAQVSIPQGNGRGPKKEWTELALIENEIPKQKKVLSIRKLLERSLGAALALKPCFMMSPASVAQFMPQKRGAFDLVVIDEASQMRPEEAVGCVARGAQVLVVGDPMQLPPTSFFDSVEVDDGTSDEEQFDVDSESVLDQALARFRPHRELRWHYRSKHHSLIAFSNREFYQSNLIVFPSPAEQSSQLGIEYVHVENGIYQASVNPTEADALVARVVQLMISRPEDSIGVVAINQPQQQLLSERFDRQFAEDPSLEEYRLRHAESLEPFFIKNLENVQGDERDVIVISTVYGPSRVGGPVFQRFGPINSKMGHRRLNVLFTRAKKRVVLVSSLRSEDIQVAPGSSAGVVAFKGYLEFARSGRLDSGSASEHDAFDSPFEAEVADVLRQSGYKVASQVGVAGYFLDLAVRHPSNSDHFILGIECDGATYHSARCARDRDKLRQQVLESLGWNIFRIWSTDWFSDRPREVEKLT